MLNREFHGSYISELQDLYKKQAAQIKQLEAQVASLAKDKPAKPTPRFTVFLQVVEDGPSPGFSHTHGTIKGVYLEEISGCTKNLADKLTDDIAKQLKERS